MKYLFLLSVLSILSCTIQISTWGTGQTIMPTIRYIVQTPVLIGDFEVNDSFDITGTVNMIGLDQSTDLSANEKYYACYGVIEEFNNLLGLSYPNITNIDLNFNSMMEFELPDDYKSSSVELNSYFKIILRNSNEEKESFDSVITSINKIQSIYPIVEYDKSKPALSLTIKRTEYDFLDEDEESDSTGERIMM